jgi:transcription elongation factor GreA
VAHPIVFPHNRAMIRSMIETAHLSRAPAISSPLAFRGRSVITRSGERALRAELESLRSKLEVEFAQRLRVARSDGAASRNDDYLQIKEEEAVLRAAISRIESLLASAQVVDESDRQAGVVEIGTLVVAQDLLSHAVHEYLVTGDFERSAHRAAVSASSPLGRAMSGRAIGQEIDVDLPNGRRRRLKIISIERPRGS